MENPQEQLDQQTLDKIFNKYTEELEKRATNPDSIEFSDDEISQIDKFIKNKTKLPKSNRKFRELLIRIGQDVRLTPDQINLLEEKFLE